MFRYTSQLSQGRIRLVKLNLTPETCGLEIVLVEVALQGATYEALSYVWGQSTEQKAIRCNNGSLSIGLNLYEALMTKKRRGSDALLWVDAICINQHDEMEKTTQVRMMRDIYAAASTVIIWFGPQKPLDISARSLVQALYDKLSGESYRFEDTFNDEDLDLSHLNEEDLWMPGTSSKWTGLFQILANPWFSRIWVVQELLVSQKSIIWKGSLDLDVRPILWTSIMIGTHRNLYIAFNNAMNSPKFSALQARSIASGFLEFQQRGALPIYDVLSRYPGMQATDPIDRFFALSGLSASLAPGFVDYNKTFADVAMLVGTMTLLGFPNYRRDSNGREVIGAPYTGEFPQFLIEWLSFNANPKNHELGIPSWVPDLISAHSPGLLMSGHYNARYLANKRKIPRPEVNPEIINSLRLTESGWEMPVPKRIDLKGAIFDTIKQIAPRRPPEPVPKDDTGINVQTFRLIDEYQIALVKWLSILRRLADPSLGDSVSITDGDSFDAFWRTLVYNRGPRFDEQNPCAAADGKLGLSFGYWYLSKKLPIALVSDRSECIKWYSHLVDEGAAPFEAAEGRVREARDFFVSETGRIGWVPFRAQVGDRICVLKGMRIPVVLRAKGTRWEFIGACYVHGLMDGEVWDLPNLQWRFIGFV